MPHFIAGDVVSLAYTIGLLVVVAGILFALYRVLMQAISTVMLWMLFGLTLVAGYSYRFELHEFGRRLFAEAIPDHANSHGATAPVVRNSEGNFSINAEINGATVTMALDTVPSGKRLEFGEARSPIT